MPGGDEVVGKEIDLAREEGVNPRRDRAERRLDPVLGADVEGIGRRLVEAMALEVAQQGRRVTAGSGAAEAGVGGDVAAVLGVGHGERGVEAQIVHGHGRGLDFQPVHIGRAVHVVDARLGRALHEHLQVLDRLAIRRDIQLHPVVGEPRLETGVVGPESFGSIDRGQADDVAAGEVAAGHRGVGQQAAVHLVVQAELAGQLTPALAERALGVCAAAAAQQRQLVVQEVEAVLLVVAIAQAEGDRQRNAERGLGQVVVDLSERGPGLGLGVAVAQEVELVHRLRERRRVVEPQVRIGEVLEVVGVEVDEAGDPP